MKKENVNQKELRTFNHPLDALSGEPSGVKIVVSGKSIIRCQLGSIFTVLHLVLVYFDG